MKIGWIGTGVMGASMAGHICDAGHDLFLYNRTPEKAEGLIQRGGCWCASPAEVARNAEIIFTIVGHPRDVEEVYLGDEGIIPAGGGCRTVVDMTTSSPKLAVRIAEEASKEGIASLDAPVSGGDRGAREATLAIMVGGDRDAFERALPLLRLMGKEITHMGDPGAGQHTKMCNQILVAGTMIGVCESLLYAARQGLDEQSVIDIIGKGAASSWLINNLGPKIARGDYAPGFYVEHFIKDMGIALEEAAGCDLSLPGLSLVRQLYIAVQGQGHGRLGTQALILALRKLNGME
ncbi:MAG: NAD(P)-dependent oxidoreductase [Deltaproteobacteria bacterium]|nr:NAD(P)-dependent oxidoreductase [Deltaproteobacteria bacterium]